MTCRAFFIGMGNTIKSVSIRFCSIEGICQVVGAPHSLATSHFSFISVQLKRRTHFRFISSHSYQLVHWNGLSSLTRSVPSHHATRKAIITILLELLGGKRLPRRVQRFLSRKASSQAGMFCKPRGSERAAERSLNYVKPAKEIQ